MRIDIRELERNAKFTFIMGTKNHHQIINRKGTYRNLVTGAIDLVPVFNELIVETVEDEDR